MSSRHTVLASHGEPSPLLSSCRTASFSGRQGREKLTGLPAIIYVGQTNFLCQLTFPCATLPRFPRWDPPGNSRCFRHCRLHGSMYLQPANGCHGDDGGRCTDGWPGIGLVFRPTNEHGIVQDSQLCIGSWQGMTSLPPRFCAVHRPVLLGENECFHYARSGPTARL